MNISIKNASDDLVAKLKERARQNHRSLQGEMLTILEDAVRPRRPLTIRDLQARVRELGISTPSESAAIIRADRDGR